MNKKSFKKKKDFWNDLFYSLYSNSRTIFYKGYFRLLYRNKILVTKIRDNEFFFFPGGHVELLENTDDAVVRELNEELYFEVRKKKLLYIHENFFEARNSKFHELCFYHLVEPIDKNLKTDDIIWQENDKGEILFHNFKTHDGL